jgi:hypothetical protein
MYKDALLEILPGPDLNFFRQYLQYRQYRN